MASDTSWAFLAAISDVQIFGLVLVVAGLAFWVGAAVGRRIEHDRLVDLAFRRMRAGTTVRVDGSFPSGRALAEEIDRKLRDSRGGDA
jgi:hypothetical protein